MPDAVVNPVSEEEFQCYGLKRVAYSLYHLSVPDNFNLGIVLEGLTGSGAGRAIFDARRFADLLRDLGGLVSYINYLNYDVIFLY